MVLLFLGVYVLLLRLFILGIIVNIVVLVIFSLQHTSFSHDVNIL